MNKPRLEELAAEVDRQEFNNFSKEKLAFGMAYRMMVALESISTTLSHIETALGNLNKTTKPEERLGDQNG